MIPSSTINAFVVSAIFTVLVPVVILIVLGIRKKISVLPLLVGAGAFFISQFVLRVPLLNALSTQGWYQDFTKLYLLYVLALSLSAGLFEESARLGGAALLKKHRRFKDVISFGLGHAFCEVILLVGFTHINNIVLCVIANDTSGTLSASLPAETLETAIAQLADVNSVHIYFGILERFSAVLFHIFATVLIFKGIVSKKWRYYPLAIAAHMLFNVSGVLTAHYTGIIASEVLMLALALVTGWYVLKSKDAFSKEVC